MIIKVKKLKEDAKIPSYQTEGAAAFDISICDSYLIASRSSMLLDIGLAFEIPKGYELQIRPRSGMSIKTNLRIANSPATIDSDYRGEVKLIVDNIGDSSIFLKKGDRVAQGLIVPAPQSTFLEVTELSDTNRGVKGFGSTGN